MEQIMRALPKITHILAILALAILVSDGWAVGFLVVGAGLMSSSSSGSSGGGASAPGQYYVLLGFLNNNYNDARFWLGKYNTATNFLATESTQPGEFEKSGAETPTMIVKDNYGGVYVIGPLGSRYLFAKYNSSGNLLWKRLLCARPAKIIVETQYIYLGGIRRAGLPDLTTISGLPNIIPIAATWYGN